MMPAMFFGHGHAMNAILSNSHTDAWRLIGKWAQIGFACRIGYACESAKGSIRVRRPLEQICHHNRFGDRSLTLQDTRVNEEETNVVSSR